MTAEVQNNLLEMNAWLAIIVFAGLLWRLIGRWEKSSVLHRSVVILFAVLELIVAMGTALAVAARHPFNESQYLLTCHGIIVLLVIFLWPRLVYPDH